MIGPPNVLFLVVDSLRYDAVTSESSETPTFDWLAAEGVTFTECYSQGVSTAPSMTAMLTGRYPLDYGGHWYLAEDQPTMAEQFADAGYATGAIHSNPNVSRLRNFDKGFDTFEEHILPWDPDGLVSHTPDRLLRYGNKLARILRKTPYVPAERVNRHIADWIDRQDEPWFCWTQYMDVHGPYLPGDEFTYRNKLRAERLWRKAAVNAPEDVTDEERAELRRNYHEEVAYLDREVGRFLDELERSGDLENTVVVLTSDHGDEFGEHGRYGHGNLPYDELTHVPLLVRFPDSTGTDQPAEVDALVRLVDLLPTLLDVANVTPSEGMAERMEGRSLLPTIEDGTDPDSEVVVTEKEVRSGSGLRFGFRTERWKYLYDGTTDSQALYDLEGDPGETDDVAGEHDEVVAEFREHLRERVETIERTSADVAVPEVDEPSGVEERLEALGYR